MLRKNISEVQQAAAALECLQARIVSRNESNIVTDAAAFSSVSTKCTAEGGSCGCR